MPFLKVVLVGIYSDGYPNHMAIRMLLFQINYKNFIHVLSVATSYGKGDDKQTEWFNCSAWGKQAELTNEYLRKGSQVYVEGRIRSREYEVDGKTRFSLDVSVNQVQFLGTGKSTSEDEVDVIGVEDADG